MNAEKNDVKMNMDSKDDKNINGFKKGARINNGKNDETKNKDMNNARDTDKNLKNENFESQANAKGQPQVPKATKS